MKPEKERIDLYLSQKTGLTRSAIQKLISTHQILANGSPVKASFLVGILDNITLPDFSLDKPHEILKQFIPLDIIYEDSFLLVINKPVGLVVQPGAGHQAGTLLNAILHHFSVDPTRPLVDVEHRYGIVHRLDQMTEGLLVVAKTNEVYDDLKRQFQKRTVIKKYFAVIDQVVAKDEFVMDQAIARNPRCRYRFFLDNGLGRTAWTSAKVLKRTGQRTLLEVLIKTGRTHQIRVHLFHAGYPVMGDPVYAPKKNLGKGQLLQAFYLAFLHPVLKKELVFEVPLSERLKRVL